MQQDRAVVAADGIATTDAGWLRVRPASSNQTHITAPAVHGAGGASNGCVGGRLCQCAQPGTHEREHAGTPRRHPTHHASRCRRIRATSTRAPTPASRAMPAQTQRAGWRPRSRTMQRQRAHQSCHAARAPCPYRQYSCLHLPRHCTRRQCRAGCGTLAAVRQRAGRCERQSRHAVRAWRGEQ